MKNTTQANAANINTMLKRINKLTPDKGVAKCGDWGVVRCTKRASESKNNKRMFSVSQSKILTNRGNYTFSDITKAFATR